MFSPRALRGDRARAYCPFDPQLGIQRTFKAFLFMEFTFSYKCLYSNTTKGGVIRSYSTGNKIYLFGKISQIYTVIILASSKGQKVLMWKHNA